MNSDDVGVNDVQGVKLSDLMEDSRKRGWLWTATFGGRKCKVSGERLTRVSRTRCSQKSLAEQPPSRLCRPLRREPARLLPTRLNPSPKTPPSQHFLPRSLSSAQSPVVPQAAGHCPAPRRKSRASSPTKSRHCRARPRKRTEHTTPIPTRSITLPKSALVSIDFLSGWIKKSNRPMATAPPPTSLLRMARLLPLLRRTRLLLHLLQ
jgi:hypothetical protein